MKLHTYSFEGLKIDIFSDWLIDARTYLISDGERQLIIDPHVDDDILKHLYSAEVISILLTHEHYDHVSGVNWLREYFSCNVYSSEYCAKELENEQNKTIHFPLYFIGDKEKYHYAKKLKLPYICKVDTILKDNEELNSVFDYGKVIETPGHSPGGMTYLLRNRYMFTGDNLLGNGMELKSIGADRDALYRTIKRYEELSEDIIVFPGHGEVDSLGYYLDIVKRVYEWN